MTVWNGSQNTSSSKESGPSWPKRPRKNLVRPLIPASTGDYRQNCIKIVGERMDSKKNTPQNNILVRFTTTYDEYRVSDSPFSVPANLGRIGLSEVINHLLEAEDGIPFDFLINGRLLRSPFGKFITHYQISTEDIINVEYFPAVTASEDTNTQEGDSWIGCIQVVNDKYAFAGSYDGNVMVFDPNNLSVTSNISSHSESIRALTAWESTQKANHINLATASKDTTIKVWEHNTSVNSSNLLYTLKGHVNSVESITRISLPNSGEDILLSGDWNGNLLGWKLAGKTAEDDNEAPTHSKKKRKVTDQKAEVIQDIKPFFTQKAHNQSITSIFSTSSFTSVYTSSWDHSFKLWDLDKLDSILTINCSKVITSLDVSSADRIATSHPDGRVRIWDTKTKEASNVPVLSFGKTNNWISQVKWMPDSDQIFASVDYSGVVSVWDVRTSVPLSNQEIHDGKGFSVAWSGLNEDNKRLVISGGSDCCLKAFQLNFSS